MYPAIPVDALAGALEMVCVACSVVITMLAYLFSLR